MSLHIITGPMFAGKTTELLHHGRRGSNTVYIKFDGDDRYQQTSPEVVSHNNEREPAIAVKRLSDADVTRYDTVCVDEGHFYPDLAETTDRWANQGKYVVVAMLVSDYNREPFAIDIIAKADCVLWKTATCQQCKKAAAFTMFTGKKDHKQDSFCIGGSQSYQPLCRSCFLQPIHHLG